MKQTLLIILSLAISNVALAEPKIQPIIQNKYYTSNQEPNNPTEQTTVLEDFSDISADSIRAFFDNTHTIKPQTTSISTTQPSHQQVITPASNPVVASQPPNAILPTNSVPVQQIPPTTIQNYGITPIPTPPPTLIPSNTAEQPSTPQPIKTLPPNPNTNLDAQQPPNPNPPKTSFWKRFTKSK